MVNEKNLKTRQEFFHQIFDIEGVSGFVPISAKLFLEHFKKVVKFESVIIIIINDIVDMNKIPHYHMMVMLLDVLVFMVLNEYMNKSISV